MRGVATVWTSFLISCLILSSHILSALIILTVLVTLSCPFDRQASSVPQITDAQNAALLSLPPAAMTVKVGDKAPEFSLKDQNGNVVDVKFGGGTPTVLFFYPKDNTPGYVSH